ncbi:MAG: TetR/AcrR family transcriptional regulator [Chloroflexi bacterium]|nr:TetR/AcrR family transcriptional regulator [Chloroflexota bacterium]
MPVAERTQSEAQRRQQILLAARRVFDEKGFESATVSDIVKRAGVAQGTFYLYFESKKSIVIELARQPMADMATRLQSILDGTESFSEILRKFVELGFAVGEENPDLCRLMHMSSDKSGAAGEFEVHREVAQMAIGMFQRFMDSGEMIEMNPGIASEMFRTIMSGAMQLAFATDPRPAPLEEMKKATEMVVLGAFVTRPT